MSEDTSNPVYKLITDDLQLALITLHTICGAIYCNQSSLFVGGCVFVWGWIYHYDNSKLRTSILTKMGL